LQHPHCLQLSYPSPLPQHGMRICRTPALSLSMVCASVVPQPSPSLTWCGEGPRDMCGVRCAVCGVGGSPRLAKAWSSHWSSHTQRLHECRERERESGVLWGSMETRATKRDREVPALSARRDLVFQLSIDGFTRVSRGAMELAHIVQPPLRTTHIHHVQHW